MKMSKILVYVEAWGYGGIESYLMDVFRVLSNSNYNCHFKLFSTWDSNQSYDNELNDLGIEREVVFSGYKPNQIVRLCDGLRKFNDILKNQHWDIVHINTMNGTGYLYAYLAKKNDVPVRIVHSHNSDVGENAKALKRIAHLLMRVFFGGNETIRLACSKEAGFHLFGKRQFHILQNGIDTLRFKYNSNDRTKIRKKLNIPNDTLLLGNPSRLSFAKNPIFQLKVFSEILRVDPTAKYVMRTEGELAQEVQDSVNELGLCKNIIFIKPMSNIEALYSAMDVMLFPSLFEGLSLMAVEAQCSGLPILSSNKVSSETAITDLMVFESLNQSPEVWAGRVLDLSRSRSNRSVYSSLVANAGYDRNQSTKLLYHYYKGNVMV